MAEQSSGSGRRTFLVALSALGSLFMGAVLAKPAIGYVLDPLRRAGGKLGRWIAVADLDSLDREHPVSLPVVGEQRDAWTRAPAVRLGTVWVQRGKANDQVMAWNAECPHLGCKVGYDKDHKKFGCPCHDSAFSADGKVLGGPAPRSLDPLETRVKDGRVEVRFVRFRAQVRERIEIG
jgi:menaquinol-cytochrome c reductase iron-sulfur subunit